MTETWRDALQNLSISTSPTGAPAGEEGEWLQLLAVFGTSGFLRVLTDGATLFLEVAAPRGAVNAPSLLEAAGWSVSEPGPPVGARRPLPVDESQMRDLWIAANHWAEAIRKDDPEAFEAALARNAETASEPEPAAPDAKPAASSTAETSNSNSPFETIGDDAADERPPLADGACAFALNVEKNWVDVVLGLAAVLEPEEYESLEKILIRNLRAKYDVAVSPIAAHEVDARLDARPQTRLGLRVTPDAVVRAIDIEGTRRAVEEYFGTIASLAKSGVDPLVFLGVRASGRLGARDTTAAAPRETPRVDEPARRSELLVDDEPPPREEEESTGVVLSVPFEPEEGAPLEPGRFEDPRLREQDASSPLVDVVLRHPGYSDRRIGQVLSILLSEEYSSCLQLAARAPVVIAWGVARARAQTMKTVIEGAGGKVFLAEPGRFGEE